MRKMRAGKSWILLMALVLPAIVLAPGAGAVEETAGSGVTASKVDVDESQVYYGNPARFKKAGEIVCDSVFREIPEYKKILDEGLTEGVRYDFLLLRANQKFRRALKAVHRNDGYDLVAEVGAITIQGKTVPDITQTVIDALP
jgi:hypothetical protein